MSEWKSFCLGDVVEFNPAEKIVTGTLAKKIAMEKLQPFCRAVTGYEVEKYNGGVKFRNGDTIMARITPCLENGKTARIDVLNDNEIGFGSTEYIVFRAKENFTVPDFVYYLIRSEVVREPAIKSMVGTSGRQRVQTDYVRNIIINLPPLDTQKKIAAVLGALDDKIELNNAINKNLEEQAQAIYNEFYKLADEKKFFSDVVQVLSGGTPKTSNNNFWNGDIPFFTPKDIVSPYVLTTEKFITSDGLKNCNSKLYPMNTTFITARGTVGKITLTGVPMAMNQSCYALVGKKISPILTYFYSLKVIQSLKHKASGSVFDSIVTNDFKSEKINLISEKESRKLLGILEPVMDKILQNALENQKLGEIRDALLPRLMSGEIDVSKVEQRR